jgi:hypothetical protein
MTTLLGLPIHGLDGAARPIFWMTVSACKLAFVRRVLG